jgi:Right handed beta helix region/RTX calcium-binding nonapeptide repeat (4 copies)
MANITGSLTADVIIPGAEINGTIPDLTVDDIIDGQTGDDIIAAAEGNDSIVGALGNDMLFGNVGLDTLDGGDGDDSLFGGKDDDSLIGGAGNDYLHGDLGVDVVYGGEGNDAIGSNSGNDTLYGGAGNDTFFGGKDQDVIYGEAGDDVISGDIGSDIVYGGSGKDTFIMGRNANGSTTGGALTADADQIMDFASGEDKIQLTADQTFDELTFVKDQGNTIIQDKVTSEFLAVIEGVTDIDATDFKSETATPGDAGVIQFSSAQYSGKEADAGSPSPNRVTITVERSGGSSGAVTVSYNTAAGVNSPAEAATDYTEVSNGVLSWGDGETGPKTFEVLLPSDGAVNVFEESETFSLLLQSPTNGAVLGDIQAAVVTINDGAAADLGAAPKLIGAELLVADAAGSFIGQVTSTTAKSYSIKGAISDGGATVENPITVDTSGKLVLTAAGATALNSVKYLDVTIATDLGAESTIRVYGNVENAMNDTIIGDALDISDGTGQDTILVGAGIYPEDVNLDKEVTLNGPAKGIAGVGTRSTEAVLKGFMSVVAGADGATVDGFTFDTDGLVDISAVVDALTVKNNIFKNQLETPVAATDVALTDFTLENNLFDALGATAVDIKGATSVTIKGNTIQNIDNDTAHGIELEDISLSATVSNNVIQLMSKADRGINILTLGVAATTGYSLSRNTIDKTGGAGIAIDTANSSITNITGNSITGSGKTPKIVKEEGGIYVNVGSTLTTPMTITGNNILDNKGGGVRVDGAAILTPSVLKISGNNFAADEVSTSNRTLKANLDLADTVEAIGGLGVFFTAAPTAVTNLTGNWWGNTTPTLVDALPSVNPRANIYSIGDAVTTANTEQANSTVNVNFNTALSSGLSI